MIIQRHNPAYRLSHKKRSFAYARLLFLTNDTKINRYLLCLNQNKMVLMPINTIINQTGRNFRIFD